MYVGPLHVNIIVSIDIMTSGLSYIAMYIAKIFILVILENPLQIPVHFPFVHVMCAALLHLRSRQLLPFKVDLTHNTIFTLVY